MTALLTIAMLLAAPKETTVALKDLTKAGFITGGTIKVPAGTKIEPARASSGKDTYGMVTLTLPAGQRVLLIERAANAPTDQAPFRKLFAQMGQTVKLERKGPTWFVLGLEQGNAFALSGETWASRPGLNCGVEQAVDLATFEVVTRICSSLTSK